MRGKIADALQNEGTAAGVFPGFLLDGKAGAKVVDVVTRQIKKNYPVPTEKRVQIECFENYAIIHGCFGNLVNETLGKALASLLSSRLGINVGTQVDAYHIAPSHPHSYPHKP